MSIYYCPSCDLYRGDMRAKSDVCSCRYCGEDMPRVGCEA